MQNIPEYIKIENYNYKDYDEYGKVVNYGHWGPDDLPISIRVKVIGRTGLDKYADFRFPSPIVTVITKEEYESALILET